jgi:hypothetical protein
MGNGDHSPKIIPNRRRHRRHHIKLATTMRVPQYCCCRLMITMAWSWIVLCHRAAMTAAFVVIPPPPWSSTTATTFPTTTTSTTALAATSGRQVRFDGASRTSVFVPFSIIQNDNDRTLPAFLRSSDSNVVLLGTPNYKQRSDGLWDCPQPRIEWFGLDLSELVFCCWFYVVLARTFVCLGWRYFYQKENEALFWRLRLKMDGMEESNSCWVPIYQYFTAIVTLAPPPRCVPHYCFSLFMVF